MVDASQGSTSVPQEEEHTRRTTTKPIPTARAKLQRRDIPRVSIREDNRSIKAKEIKVLLRDAIEDGGIAKDSGKGKEKGSSKAKERGRKDGECEMLPGTCTRSCDRVL